MKNNLFALIGGTAVGFAVGFLISPKLLNRPHRHTGGSFLESYNDNREGGEDPCE